MKANSIGAGTQQGGPHFASKVDPWMRGIMGLVVSLGFLSVPVVMFLLTTQGDVPLLLLRLLAGCAAASATLVLWTFANTGYEITKSELIARSGPFRWRVRLEAIEAVVPSRAIQSSPALSLDRLEIRHRDSPYGTLVSPKDRKGFLDALLLACPHLTLAGDALKRTSS